MFKFLHEKIENSEEGVELVRKNEDTTVASSGVQDILKDRINLMKEEKKPHHAKVILPYKVAQIIRADPKMLAFAVYAFMNREEESPKLSPLFSREDQTFDSVEMMIPFTKSLFAQLYHQIPLETKKTSEDADFLASDLGLKITIGMQLLVSDDFHINHIDLIKLASEREKERAN